MDEKIFRKENRADEDFSDFCIFRLQFLLKNYYIAWIQTRIAQNKNLIFRGLGGSSPFFQNLGGGVYKSLDRLQVDIMGKTIDTIAGGLLKAELFLKIS